MSLLSAKVKNILIIILCCLCLYFGVSLKIKGRKIDILSSQTAALEGELKRKIIIKENQIIYKYRAPAADKTNQSDCAAAGAKDAATYDAGGNSAVVTENYFIPVEGRAEILQTKEDEVKINLTDKGLTLRPFCGALYANGGGDFFCGARFAYFKRFGAGAALARQGGLMIILDRRLDDILPLKNISLALLAGKDRFGAGAAVYL